MRLANVLADGEPVTYSMKFSVSRELLRSTLQAPVPRDAPLHPPRFQFAEPEG